MGFRDHKNILVLGMARSGRAPGSISPTEDRSRHTAGSSDAVLDYPAGDAVMGLLGGKEVSNRIGVQDST